MARKLDRGDDQEQLQSTDGEPPPDRSPLTRRSYLGIGATTVAGLAVTGASTGTLQRHGIAFDRTLDAVENLGLDPTGVDAVDGQLQQVGDGTLVQFPEGEYRFGSGGLALGADRVGFEGTGDSVSFVASETSNGVLLEGAATKAYLDGITLAHGDGSSPARIRLRGERIVLQRLEPVRSPVQQLSDTDQQSAGTDSLVVHGPGTNYEVTVDGRIESGEQPPGYAPSGTNAEGVVDADADRYTVDGRITDLRLDGTGAVSLNGHQVDPAQFGSGYPSELAFAPTGTESYCTFSVAELSPWGRPIDGDEVTVPDSAGGSYRFDGAVESLSARGTVALSFGTPGRF